MVLVTACHSLEASIGNWLLSNGMVEHRLKIQSFALFGIPINRKFQVFTGTIMMRCAVSLVIKVKLVQRCHSVTSDVFWNYLRDSKHQTFARQ